LFTTSNDITALFQLERFIPTEDQGVRSQTAKMVNVGRFFCVAIPFILAVGSVIAMLVAGLAGVADKSLYMFQINTTDLSISPASISNILDKATRDLDKRMLGFHDPNQHKHSAEVDSSEVVTTTTETTSSNITAADLSLMDLYDIGLWGWCYTAQNDTRQCTKPQFNWAEKTLNATTNSLKSIATSAGQTLTLPDEITSAISAFSSVTKWTEVVFFIAIIALAAELLFGIFANCSRAFSCITMLVAIVATVAVCAFAAMATAMSVIVTGAVEGSAKFYGVQADLNTKYLAAVWIAAAFAIAAGFFWMFTVCCCAPDHSSRRSHVKHRDNGEKFVPVGAYQPLHEDGAYHGGYGDQHSNPQYGYAPQQYAPRREGAYEPYSHSHV
jgi:hypothetical protein